MSVIGIEIGGVDYSDSLKRDELPAIGVNVENDDGSQMLNDISCGLSNQDSALNTALALPGRPTIVLKRSGTQIFDGLTDQDGLVSDVDGEAVSCSAIAFEAETISTLKSKKIVDCVDLVSLRESLNILKVTGSPFITLPRYFFHVNTLLEAGFASFGFDYDGTLAFQEYYIGGVQTSVTEMALLPDWTVYDFLNAVVKCFRCVWHIVKVAGIPTIVLRTKAEHLAAMAAIAELDIPIIAKTLKVRNQGVGFDQISLTFDVKPENYTTAPTGRYPDEEVYNIYEIHRSTPVVLQDPVETTFKTTRWFEEADPSVNRGSWIPEEENDNSVLLRKVTMEGGYLPVGASAKTIIEALHAIELEAISRSVARYSLIDDGDKIPDLAAAFYTHFMAPETAAGEHFIVSADIDLGDESVEISTVGYDV